MRLRHILLIICCLFALKSTVAQLSTRHYIPPITAHPNDPPSNIHIYISTPRTNDVTFTITPIGDPGNVYTNTVNNTFPFIYRVLQAGQDQDNPGSTLDNDGDNQFATPQNFSNTVLNDRGYIIEASDVIYVSVRFRSDPGSLFQAGALVSKGLSGLGTTFRVGGFVNETGSINGFLTFASIMATEDDTDITFSGFPNSISILNHTGSGPVNATLDEGETFFLAVSDGGNPNDLIGSLITSDKPIVVNTGSLTGSFADGFSGRDYGVDQIADASRIGSEYIFVKGNGGDANGDQWENVLIIAHTDNTTLSINGNPLTGTLNAGEATVIEGDLFTNDNMYVEASNPVFAYQGIGGQNGNAPNQGLFFVPPLSCENRGDVNNIANIDQIGTGNFPGGVTIVTEVGSTVNISENGVPRAINPTEGPFNVDGNPNYQTYKLIGLSGNVSVTSSGELYCAYFNANGFAASGSFYSGFPTPPEITFNTNIMALGNCIPNVTLESQNTDLFDTFEWFLDDGSGGGFVGTGNTSASFTPSQPGDYKLVGTIACSGTTFDSQVIPVSLCPDDQDDDLIIDNIDIDLDNDGISNCDESRGNVVIDYTDTNQPILNFADATTDNTFVTASTDLQGNTLTGDSNGNFVTTIAANAGTFAEYSLAFNESANIDFRQDSNTTHTIVTGETYIISIGPNSKNLTLLDPSNILLVDTDFDGIFETGVDNFSSSEIRFQFNPAPTGTEPFRFVANSIDLVTFRHEHVNVADGSSFSGNLSLTCFTLDSDGDGVPDSLDGDSDNDGIPDLIEAQGVNVVLLGDADLDGLDDVFGGNFIVPIDSDNDGVVDYLDVDADNDGIYDLFEADHDQDDIDLDGRIDNAINLVGENGLIDALETNADSFVLSYIVGNVDTDNLFNYLDIDSDGDICYDSGEAGFTDTDLDGILGTSPVTVDAVGRVINVTDGYTIPNQDYLIFNPIEIVTPFEDVAFCEASTSTITIDSTADTWQWEISTDGGNNWNNITDGPIYSGSTTATLQITNILLAYDGHQFRVFMQ